MLHKKIMLITIAFLLLGAPKIAESAAAAGGLEVPRLYKISNNTKKNVGFLDDFLQSHDIASGETKNFSNQPGGPPGVEFARSITQHFLVYPGLSDISGHVDRVLRLVRNGADEEPVSDFESYLPEGGKHYEIVNIADNKHPSLKKYFIFIERKN